MRSLAESKIDIGVFRPSRVRRGVGERCPNLCPFEEPDWNLVIILDFKLHVFVVKRMGAKLFISY